MRSGFNAGVRIIFIFVCSALVIVAGPLHSLASVPEVPASPSQYVEDLAGIIDSATKERLNASLRELEEKTTVQMVVLTIQSLNGDNIDEFSIRTVEKWKLGQKGKDNGVLMTVSLQDRKYRIEIGYGLERVLPDSLTGSIGRAYLVPNFKRGDYSKGISDTVFAITHTIAAAEGVTLAGSPAPQVNYGRKLHTFSPVHGLLMLFFLIAAVILFIRHPVLFTLLFLSSGRGGWSGGGGGSGGFGGFGGGGGGGFGGGGASGDW